MFLFHQYGLFLFALLQYPSIFVCLTYGICQLLATGRLCVFVLSSCEMENVTGLMLIEDLG